MTKIIKIVGFSILLVTIFLSTPSIAQIEAPIDMSDNMFNEISNGLNCDQLPCTFTSSYGWKITIEGDFFHDIESAGIQSSIFINDEYFGYFEATATQVGNDFNYQGQVQRVENNAASLPALQLPFDITLEDALDPQLGIPELDVPTVIVQTILFTFIDFKTNISQTPPKCSDFAKKGHLGCDGPVTGLGALLWIIPVPIDDITNDASVDCCIAHDICYLNGGEKECQKNCDEEFAKCIQNSYQIPILDTIFVTAFTALMPIVVGNSPGFHESTDGCRCQFNLTQKEKDTIRKTKHNVVTVLNKNCCETPKDKCKSESDSCRMAIFTPEGNLAAEFRGECKQPPAKSNGCQKEGNGK